MFQLPQLKKIVTTTMIAMLVGIRLAYAASGTVVAFGASQTEGHGVSTSDAYPAQLESILRAKGHNISVINAGHSGETTDLMLARLDSDVPDGTKLVILQPGGNDARRGGGIDHEGNVAEMKRRLAQRKIKVLMWTKGDIAGLPVQGDELHFTAEGYRMLAQRFMPKVLAMIGGR